MTSNHHGPYVLGYTRATMVGTLDLGIKRAQWDCSIRRGMLFSMRTWRTELEDLLPGC